MLFLQSKTERYLRLNSCLHNGWCFSNFHFFGHFTLYYQFFSRAKIEIKQLECFSCVILVLSQEKYSLRGYCLCYCKTFSLLPDPTQCTNIFLPKSAVHYLYHLKLNNIIDRRKTPNFIHDSFDLFNLKLCCT